LPKVDECKVMCMKGEKYSYKLVSLGLAFTDQTGKEARVVMMRVGKYVPSL